MKGKYLYRAKLFNKSTDQYRHALMDYVRRNRERAIEFSDTSDVQSGMRRLAASSRSSNLVARSVGMRLSPPADEG